MFFTRTRGLSGLDSKPGNITRTPRWAFRRGHNLRRLILEQLEDRRLLSITAWSDENVALVADFNHREALIADVNLAAEIQNSAVEASQFAPGEIVVGFEDGVTAAYRTRGAAALEAAGKVVEAEGLHSPRALMDLPAKAGRGARLVTHWQLPAGADVLDVVNRLTGYPGIAYAEPNYVVSIEQTLPNDPKFDDLWGLHNTDQTGGTADADIDGPEAWDITTGSGDIIVAVIDTGVDYDHPDLAANIWTNSGEIAGNGIDDDGNGYVDDVRGWDFAYDDNDPFDGDGHGTNVSGTIGAFGNNGAGVAGVNWNVQIMPLKFLDDTGSGYTDDAVDAINYAIANGAHLTSNSWGGGGFSQALENAIAASASADMLFIAAAGNSGTDTDASPHYPSSYDLDNIISVAATDASDDIATYGQFSSPFDSNYGLTSVDLGAPGVSILSTTPGNNYSYFYGTSMATPHVAGVAALAWGLSPGATQQEIKAAILAGVDPVASMSGITVTGGRLNAYGTLQELLMVASAFSPFDGEVISDLRQDFEIDFSSTAKPSTVQAEDLEVSFGATTLGADSVILSGDGMTATLQFDTSPITTIGYQGEYAMTIAAGAIERASDDEPLKSFTANFRYDATLMAVTGTDPANGSVFSLPLNPLSSASSAIVSSAGMDGGNGGWPILYGDNAVTKDTLSLAIDEDQLLDPERSHTTEQVAFIVFDDATVANCAPFLSSCFAHISGVSGAV